MTQDGVRTFLPSGHLAMARPAITRPVRRFHCIVYSQRFACAGLVILAKSVKDSPIVELLAGAGQLVEFGFCKDGDAEFLGFVIFRSGVGADDDVVRFLADGA
jgi:hypothetical protein